MMLALGFWGVLIYLWAHPELFMPKKDNKPYNWEKEGL